MGLHDPLQFELLKSLNSIKVLLHESGSYEQLLEDPLVVTRARA
jgi:hypothetical protein